MIRIEYIVEQYRLRAAEAKLEQPPVQTAEADAAD